MVNAVYLIGNLAEDPKVNVYENREGSITYTKFVLISGPDKGKIAKMAVSTSGKIAQIAAGFKKGRG